MKLIVVTGSSRGIGEALALEAAEAGYAVLGIARQHSALLLSAANRGQQVEQLTADLTSGSFGVDELNAGLDRLLASVGASAISQAVLVNNAGMVDPIGQGEQLDAQSIARSCLLNLAAPMALTSAFLGRLRGRAARLQVLNISSGAGRRPMPGWSVYCATKAGLDLYSQTLAAEEAARGPHGARVVSLAPGVVDTAMQGRIREHSSQQFPAVGNFVAMKADGKLNSAQDVARKSMRFLASASFGDPVIADLRELDQRG